MTPKEFINQVLLGEYPDIVDRHAYISFALIGLGIEFLGACLDQEDFGKFNEFRNRFNLAIIELFPQKYQSLNLCDDLRNGFAHQLRPGSSVELTEKKHADPNGWKHFSSTPKGKTYLVVEDLYKDFRDACTEVVRRIDAGELSHSKIAKEFLSV